MDEYRRAGRAEALGRTGYGYAWPVRVPLTVAARLVAGCLAGLSLAGCAAGQITQTDNQVAAVDGAFGDVGNAIALREVLIPYPPNQQGSYPAGSAVPVMLTIVNQTSSADQLTAVTSPAASQVLVLGSTQIPPGSTLTSAASAVPVPVSGEPTSPLVSGELRVVLITTRPLHAGLDTPVTFQFRNAGRVTLPVPMAAPPSSAGQA